GAGGAADARPRRQLQPGAQGDTAAVRHRPPPAEDGRRMAELSIRQGGRWGGLCDASASLPTMGTFSRLVGCYPSKDGTELRRWPGSIIGARPFLGEAFAIMGGTKGATTLVSTTAAHWH